MFQIKPLVQSPLPVKALDARSFYFELYNTRDSKNFGQFIGELNAMYTQGVDFVLFLTSKENLTGGRPRKDYAITLEVAKNMALLSRTPNGKAYRKYLIEFETAVRKAPPPPPAPRIEGVASDQMCALAMMSKEFNVNGADKIIMFEKGLASFPDLQNALPSYSSTKFAGSHGEVSERAAHAYGYHRKKFPNELLLSAAAFNTLLLVEGFIEQKVSSSGKKFKALTAVALEYGKNVSPKQSSTQVQIHWYDDTILEFYELITNV